MSQVVDDAIRQLRITIGGMIAGVVCFGALAYAVAGNTETSEDLPRAQVLFAVFALFGAGSAVGYLIQYRKMVGEARARVAELRQTSEPAEMVVEIYRRFAIVGGGLIEGPAFFALILYILTKSPIALAAAGLGVALLVLHMPSRERLEGLAEKGTQL